MRALLPLIAFLTITTVASGATITVNCAPTAGTTSFTVGNSLQFISAVGTGTFNCSDAFLGPHVLNSVSVNLLIDYNTGNGTNTDPNDNSAGFTFSNASTSWGVTHGSPLLPNTTMNLSTGVTLFVIGNANSNSDTFTNTTSGGLGGTAFTEPAIDAQTGSLVGVFGIPVTAFVDAGGFSSGVSAAHVLATYDYTLVVTTTPEPISIVLVGAGLLGTALLRRRRPIA
jgi:PEP-CTERM motif